MTQQTGRQRDDLRRTQRDQVVITDPTVCYFCKSKGLTEMDNFCPNCAFPQKGTQADMRKFIWNVRNKQRLLDDQKKAVNKARTILFVLAAFFAVAGALVGLTVQDNPALFIENLVVAIIYLGLGIWSRKNPFPAFITGFFLYIVLQVINAILNPITILQGFILKGFIIAGFIYGYKAVKESAALEKELDAIKNAQDLTPPDEVPQVPNGI